MSGIDRTKRGLPLVGAVAAILLLVAPVSAGQPRTVVWQCNVPGEGLVNFVTAAEAARYGITQANSHAGVVFRNQFGEECTVL
jgi:hypothetical protein